MALVGFLVFGSFVFLALGLGGRAPGLDRLGRLKDRLAGGLSQAPESWLARIGGAISQRFSVGDLATKCLQANVSWKPEEVLAAKVVLAVGLPAFFALLAVVGGKWLLLIALSGAVLGFFGPDYYLQMRIKSRKKEIDGGLLLFADVLATALEAGLPLSTAIDRISEHEGGVVAQEFRRVGKEIKAGRPRQEAWKALGERHASDELRAVVASIAQAEQLGSPVARALRIQARELRLARTRYASELPQQLNVKVNILGIVMILMPTTALVLIPAFLEVATAFGR